MSYFHMIFSLNMLITHRLAFFMIGQALNTFHGSIRRTSSTTFWTKMIAKVLGAVYGQFLQLQFAEVQIGGLKSQIAKQDVTWQFIESPVFLLGNSPGSGRTKQQDELFGTGRMAKHSCTGFTVISTTYVSETRWESAGNTPSNALLILETIR